MQTTFRLDGIYSLVIVEERGYQGGPAALQEDGTVSLNVMRDRIPPPTVPDQHLCEGSTQEFVWGTLLSPSHARAIASALLAAATETKRR